MKLRHSRQTWSWTTLFLILMAIVARVVRSEEESIITGSTTVSNVDVETSFSGDPPLVLINGAYKGWFNIISSSQYAEA